ncbi:MAG: hypothetical protein [Cotesia congregata filamentous virus 2]
MANRNDFSWDLYTLPAYFTLTKEDKYFKTINLNCGVLDMPINLPANSWNYLGNHYQHYNSFHSIIGHKDPITFFSNLLDLSNSSNNKGLSEKRVYSILEPQLEENDSSPLKKKTKTNTSMFNNNYRTNDVNRYTYIPEDDSMEVVNDDDNIMDTSPAPTPSSQHSVVGNSKGYLNILIENDRKIMEKLENDILLKDNYSIIQKINDIKKYYIKNQSNEIDAIKLIEKMPVNDLTEEHYNEFIKNAAKNKRIDFDNILLQTFEQKEANINILLAFLKKHVTYYDDLINENILKIYPNFMLEPTGIDKQFEYKKIIQIKYIIQNILNQKRFQIIDHMTLHNALMPIYKTLFYIEVLKKTGYEFNQLNDHNVFDLGDINDDLNRTYTEILQTDSWYSNLKGYVENNKETLQHEPLLQSLKVSFINRCVHYDAEDNSKYIRQFVNKFKNTIANISDNILHEVLVKIINEQHIVTEEQWHKFVEFLQENILVNQSMEQVEQKILYKLIHIVRSNDPAYDRLHNLTERELDAIKLKFESTVQNIPYRLYDNQLRDMIFSNDF